MIFSGRSEPGSGVMGGEWATVVTGAPACGFDSAFSAELSDLIRDRRVFSRLIPGPGRRFSLRCAAWCRGTWDATPPRQRRARCSAFSIHSATSARKAIAEAARTEPNHLGSRPTSRTSACGVATVSASASPDRVVACRSSARLLRSIATHQRSPLNSAGTAQLTHRGIGGLVSRCSKPSISRPNPG
jgi:hypothetical protein